MTLVVLATPFHGRLSIVISNSASPGNAKAKLPPDESDTLKTPNGVEMVKGTFGDKADVQLSEHVAFTTVQQSTAHFVASGVY